MSLLVQPNTFQVEATEPLDDRMQVDSISDRDNLFFKWLGMRVYVIDQQTLYLLTDEIPSDIWVAIGGAAGSGGHTIQQDGTPFTQRQNLDFIASFTITDNAGSDSSEVTLTEVEGGTP